MTEQSRVLAATLAGAALGCAFGWLYWTESGGRFRLEAEPRLDDFQRELQRLRSSIRKAREVAIDSWESINELVGERPHAAWTRT